jgi:hypothetical protein
LNRGIRHEQTAQLLVIDDLLSLMEQDVLEPVIRFSCVVESRSDKEVPKEAPELRGVQAKES